jgi:hypothetical protein
MIPWGYDGVPGHNRAMLPPHPRRYVCCKIPRGPNLDGTLSDAPWDKADWTELFVDIQGDAMPTPRFATRAKMLWDDEYLYIGADMEEPQLWATYTEHDSIVFHEHDFEVFIDPDGDNHGYFEIEINALGTVFDLKLVKPYRDGGPALHEWHAEGMLKAVHLRGTLNEPATRDDGWSVELAIPWSCLERQAPQSGDTWRINFSRVEWQLDVIEGQYVKRADTPEDNWVWTPQGVIDMHRPEMWGYVLFSESDVVTECPPDPDHETRMLLMHVYWGQKVFRAEHGHYSDSVTQLGLSAPVSIVISEDGYRATLSGLSITHESRITPT